VNKILCRGAINEAAEAFNVHRSTIRRVWQRGLSSLDQGSTLMDALTMRKNCGRKKKNIQPQLDGIAQIPLNRRSSLRSTASAVGVSLTILHRRLKDGDLRKHNSIIKPTLSQQHRLRRVDFCKSFLCFLDRRKFYDMNDVIHVDKKWFYLTKVKRKYYLGNDEPNPHPTLRSKRFITKVMFLTDSPERRRSRIV